MVLPWTGFPLSSLLQRAEPLSSARYIRLVTLDDPQRFPGVREQSWYPWPYFEGLRMDEAMHPLSFLALGCYGQALPPQNGAPLRLVLPWKYGFKSIKAIARIDFLTEEPATFWSQLVPEEYDFLGNVRPDQPHPRWSQASERMIPTGERIPTRMFNGYADQVADLYT